MIQINKQIEQRVRQGDVIRNVEYIERVTESNGTIEISKVTYPLVLVLTQDCDLQQDHTFRTESRNTQDKWLVSVLVAPLYNASHLIGGNHLEKLQMKSQAIEGKTHGQNLKNNQMPRYHYLAFPPECGVVPSVVDFKHYFSVPVEYLVRQKAIAFECAVADLYRGDISHRFAAFLSRIGLPNPIAELKQDTN